MKFVDNYKNKNIIPFLTETKSFWNVFHYKDIIKIKVKFRMTDILNYNNIIQDIVSNIL